MVGHSKKTTAGEKRDDLSEDLKDALLTYQCTIDILGYNWYDSSNYLVHLHFDSLKEGV